MSKQVCSCTSILTLKIVFREPEMVWVRSARGGTQQESVLTGYTLEVIVAAGQLIRSP